MALLLSHLSKAELFAQTFALNSTLDDTGLIPPFIPPSNFVMPSIKITYKYVFYALSGLDSRKAYGPDGAPPFYCCQKLCFSACFLPGQTLSSLSTSSISSCWKIAHIQPVPKKGDPSNPSTYRHIAVTSCFSKGFESVINRKTLNHLSHHTLLPDHLCHDQYCRNN